MLVSQRETPCTSMAERDLNIVLLLREMWISTERKGAVIGRRTLRVPSVGKCDLWKTPSFHTSSCSELRIFKETILYMVLLATLVMSGE